MSQASFLRTAAPVAIALAIGAVGGTAFAYLTLPLPWLLGAIACVTFAALAGINVGMSRELRNVFITILGVMLGSQFSLDLLARMGQWATSLAALAAWMVLVTVVGVLYMRKVAGYDLVTAFFSTTPGGLTEMLLIGGRMGGDERVISLTHAARVMVVVFSIPLWYRFGGEPVVPPPRVGLTDVPLADVGVLALCAVLGAVGARRLRLPAANLIGPMILSAAAHLVGITASQPPYAIVALALLVIGTSVGCRFRGITLAAIGHILRHAAIAAILMLALTLASAFVVAALTGLPLPAIVLAFAPGGLAEMSLVALALSLDPAFVAVHHVFRILVVVIVAPLVFRVIRRGAPRARD